MRAPTLIIGYGNPSRGDDAIGPAAIAEIEARAVHRPDWGPVETMTDFQLQLEFVTDLADRQRVVFIDAAANGPEPFSFSRIEAKHDGSVTTHSLSPAGLLMVFRSFHEKDAPSCFLLGIRGYDFALGAPISVRAQSNLDAAIVMLEQWLTTGCTTQSMQDVML